MVQDLQDIESIYDFFYLDNPKIKSFYAQLNGRGALNTLKDTSQISDIRKLEASIGIPTVTGGKAGNDHGATTTAEKVFDGIPTMPREMINRLDELGFIYRDLVPENLGSLILLKGALSVDDIETTKNLMEPALGVFMHLLQTDKPSQRTEKNKIKTLAKPFLEFLKNIPFSLSCNLYVQADDDSLTDVWMSLSRDGMSSNIHDINFKHGQKLAGQWYVLGILDAIPNIYDENKRTMPDKEGLDQFKSALSDVMKQFGRNDTAYGITPIAIFRELKPQKQ